MNLSDLEKAFGRALFLSASKIKLMVACAALLLCGLFMVFCRAAAYGAGEWVSMSFLFLPLLLSSGVLLALGVLLIRLHYREAKQQPSDWKKLILSSGDLLIGTSYLAVFPILAYLLLWVVLGIFFLLKEIPYLGDFFSIVLSFGPFLLIFGSLLLCFLSLGLLFFAVPPAALQSLQKMALLKKVIDVLVQHPLRATLLFLIGLLPPAILGTLLSMAAAWTNVSFVIAQRSLTVALEWFFIMLPFCAILSPAVVFFFNFSAESYQFLQNTPSSPFTDKSRFHGKD